MKENVKQWLYLFLLTFFIIIILLTILSFQYTGDNYFMLLFVKHHIFLMFTTAILGVIFGSITQIMTSKKIESNEKKLILLKKYFFKSITIKERKILRYLIQNNGVTTQYELTKIEGLNKLNVSRFLINMEKNGFIEKKRIGKINKIFLNKEVLKILS